MIKINDLSLIIALSLFSTGQLTYASEENTETSENAPAISTFQSKFESQIENPLVNAAQDHGQLYLSAYDPEHQLYPVKILSIDGWIVNDDVLNDELLLPAGVHKIRVVPDFSNIEPALIFMDAPWQELHISFEIANEQKIAITARLINTINLQWKVQLYPLDLPDNDSSFK